MTRYRALTGLTYPTDPAVIKRLQAGEQIPRESIVLRTVAVGQVVSDVPEVSVPWLLEQGAIEEVVNG